MGRAGSYIRHHCLMILVYSRFYHTDERSLGKLRNSQWELSTIHDRAVFSEYISLNKSENITLSSAMRFAKGYNGLYGKAQRERGTF